ncbi:unnamed protein product [Prorocentrum cordatum]|nr:unnamed protein product [Polarella glacialis]|mmetsp:Transcript_35927/g.96336  ORF Transcript_35927/g.96336 Transcript_35927/m.96336 type:complete len:279 (-) Transcript_35927:72-908(-)
MQLVTKMQSAPAELAMDAGDQTPGSAWKLCVRGTFLDPVDPAGPTVKQVRRRSDPGLHSDRPSFFAEEEGYAKQLQAKMNGLGGPSATEEFARLSTVAPSRRSSRGSRGSSGFSWPGPPEGEALPHGFPSNGSLGHPHLCRRPCKDAASCRASCSFCHLPHEARRPQLDKINRLTLRLVDRHALIEALLGTMRGRVAELGLGEEALRALEEWREDVAAAPPAAAEAEAVRAATPWEVRRLQRFLRALHLNDLCFLPVPLDIRAASNRMMDKLRDLRVA